MKVTYDPEVDVLRILLSSAEIEESDEDKPGVVLDYDKNGNVVGMEILDASRRMEDPQTMEYAVTGADRLAPPVAMIREKSARVYGAPSRGKGSSTRERSR